jgi:hypothetical protein
MSRWVAAILSCALPVFAAVEGVVTNGSTNKPQPKVIVSLIQPGAQGMQTLASSVTDAEGKFKIDRSAEGAGPQIIQAIYDGVPYTKVLPPGTPTTGVPVVVYDATKSADVVGTEQHAIFIQPGANTTEVAENLLMKNDSKLTYNDAANGTLHFYLPPEAKGSVRVTINTISGMPIQRPAEPVDSKSSIYKVSYPIKPGETLFTIVYSLPASEPRQFASRILGKSGAVLVVPKGVTLEGDAQAAGEEPRFNAPKYTVKPGDFKVRITGSGSFTAPGEDSSQQGADDSGQPQLTQSNPRLYGKLYLVLGLATAILGLGFIVLYRTRSGEPRARASNPPAPKGKQRG